MPPGVYHTTYYPVGYRGPLIAFHHAPHPGASNHVPRPYIQHYQYTQYSLGNGDGGQFPVQISNVASTSGNFSNNNGNSGGSNNNKNGNDGGVGCSGRKVGDPTEDGDDFNNTSSPGASEFLNNDHSEVLSQENFVRFLEKSCHIAENIANRNKNRPCFRNIQNLCIRTRSEIMKPCTTISNIHSQGIPWATKDFIYAFVRLTNCWHILKGYWDNRDGSSLGKIEKELTPEFRACYIRWEKETMELAAQLTRVFYNLDTNLASTQPKSNQKSQTVETFVNNNGNPNGSNNKEGNLNVPQKNVRGIIHLPSAPTTQTMDQANQTYSGDFDNEVYMKPGSYNVPKKDKDSPRDIEFLETAQNVNRNAKSNDGYWGGGGPSALRNKNKEPKQDIISECDLDLAHLNVHDWLLSSNFSDFGEPSPLSTSALFDNINETSTSTQIKSEASNPISLFQRKKSHMQQIDACSNHFQNIITLKLYETPDEGITEIGYILIEKLLTDLKRYNILEGLDITDKAIYLPMIDIDAIANKLKNGDYIYINEVVRDLRYLIGYFYRFSENFVNVDLKKRELVNFVTEMFAVKLRDFLNEQFPDFDFSEIKGDLLQNVGPLKLKPNRILSDDNNQQY